MKKTLILGSRGRLGAALVRLWASRTDVVGLARPEVDLSDPSSLPSLFERDKYDAVVNCAGLTSLEQCEDDPGLARRVNEEAVAVLAEEAARREALFIHFGTDYVYDGELGRAYTEEDPARPLSVYGASKLAGELAAVAASPRHLVFRVSWVFGPDKPSFVDMILRRAAEFPRVEAVDDKTSSPSYTADIAEWVFPFLSGELPGGIYHACNSGACSWREYGQFALDVAGERGWPLKTGTVEPIPLASMTSFRAARPRRTVMDCSKLGKATGRAIAPWQDALRRYLSDRNPEETRSGAVHK